MTAKKINELSAKTPVSTDVIPVADPTTGVAGKSTIAQILAGGGLPAITIANALKPLVIKADGTGAEWGTITRVLEVNTPVVTAGNVGNSIIVAAGAANGAGIRGGDVFLNPGTRTDDTVEVSSVIVDAGSSYKNDSSRVFAKSVFSVRVGSFLTSSNPKTAIVLTGYNNYMGQGSGVILGWIKDDSNITYGGTPNWGAFISTEYDVGNSRKTRMQFATSKDEGGINNGLVIWSNGSITVGTTTVAAYNPTHEADSIHAKGPIKTDVGFAPPSLADSSAGNNRIYFSTTSSKLVYKDSSGVVNQLYP